MNFAFLKKITLEGILIYILIAAALATFIFVGYLVTLHFTKSVQVTSPNGLEEWAIGATHTITWKAKGVDKVGIVLFKSGGDPKWIAKNVNASLGRYDWKIYAGQPYGDDYAIAVFEYPWRKGNEISYSKGTFAVTFPELFSCDNQSLQIEWPELPSDLPNIRRVFITARYFNGNLDGLDGADQICQADADQQKLGGRWRAFIGGDGEQETAIERMKQAPRKTDGFFVAAKADATLLRGSTCHRLLGKTLDDFLGKLSDLVTLNEDKFGADFSDALKNIWLGRINASAPARCTSIASVINNNYIPLAARYSATTTCQNWTQDTKFVTGYPVPAGTSKPLFPTCYTSAGKLTDAVAIGGINTSTTGGAVSADHFITSQAEYCDAQRHLLCIEE